MTINNKIDISKNIATENSSELISDNKVLLTKDSTLKQVENILSQNSDNNKSIIKNIKGIENLDQNEIEKYIIGNIINSDIKFVNIPKIINNKKLHGYIHNIIGKNYPLLEISRLIPNEKVVNITFKGIKKINDEISKDFVDLFIYKLKEIINRNFEKNLYNEKHGRLIRSNYKHLTFSLDKDIDISRKLFNHEKSKANLINNICENITDEELEESLKNSVKQNLDKKLIKQIIEEEFNFGIGASLIKQGGIQEKLKSFYMGEISSRNIADSNNLGDNLDFNFSKILENSTKAIEIEKEIVNGFMGSKFTIDSTNYDIVINGNINPILLKYARKGKEINILNNKKILKRLVSKYIDCLNDGFDFISPVINEEEFDNLEYLNNQVHNGIIESKYFLETYKNTLSTETLKTISEGKEGIRIFIDIVDMGIMNIFDFRELAQKVVSGDITEENTSELLNAGNTATNKFQKLVKEIQNIYPESKISLGGDEIFIFIPEKNKESLTINKVSNCLSKNYLKGRISSSCDKNNQCIYEGLDSITNINKVFEKRFEELIHNNWKLEEYNKVHIEPVINHIDISDSKLKLINGNLEYFKELLKNEISDNRLIKLLKNQEIDKKNIKYKINNLEGNININFEKQNNFINIKIN